MQLEKITVLGAGSWGTTLANHLAQKGYNTHLWLRSRRLLKTIEESGENSEYLPGVKLLKKLTVSTSLEQSLASAEMVVSSVPSHGMRAVFKSAGGVLKEDVIIVNTSKGIEEKSGLTGSGLLSEFGFKRVVILSGPTFAGEVSCGLPCAISAASADLKVAEVVQEVFSSSSFRVYTNTDVTGVEIGGALKNVVAIASGISDGLGLGTNARAALITRGLVEITRLGEALGASRDTFYGLSGLGDLVLTCTGKLSRNRSVGLRIGKGEKLGEIIDSMNMVAEGVRTSRATLELAAKHDVKMPITEEINRVLFEDKSPRDAVLSLMNRGLKEE